MSGEEERKERGWVGKRLMKRVPTLNRNERGIVLDVMGPFSARTKT